MNPSDAESPSSKAMPASESKTDPAPTSVYDHKARLFKAQYKHAFETYDRDKEECKELCLKLLKEPSLPFLTRVETLHLLTTVVPYRHAMKKFTEAFDTLNEMESVHGETDDSKFLRIRTHKMIVKLNKYMVDMLEDSDESEEDDEENDQEDDEEGDEDEDGKVGVGATDTDEEAQPKANIFSQEEAVDTQSTATKSAVKTTMKAKAEGSDKK